MTAERSAASLLPRPTAWKQSAASASLCCVVTTTDKLVAFSVSTKAKVAEASAKADEAIAPSIVFAQAAAAHTVLL